MEILDLAIPTLEDYANPNENPLKIIRKQLGLTQLKLATLANVSRMVVLRTEQGMYASIPDKLLTQLSLNAGFSVPRAEIQPAYETWQRDQRLLQEWVNDPFEPRGTNYRAFTHWRRTVTPVASAMGFCRLLCVHPNSLRTLESGTSDTFPSQIGQALVMAGLEPDRLEYLYALTPGGLSTYGERL